MDVGHTITSPLRVSVNGSLFVIDAVADRAADKRSSRGTENCASERVTAATIVSNNCASDRAECTARYGTLLGVRTCAHAPTQEEREKREQRAEKCGLLHGRNMTREISRGTTRYRP